MDKKISITEVQKGDKTYFQIQPKKQLDAGESIVITKLFEDGREFTNTFDGKPTKSYSITVEYDGNSSVSFFLSEKEYEDFSKFAVNDMVRIKYGSKIAKFTKNGKPQERKYLGLVFEKA